MGLRAKSSSQETLYGKLSRKTIRRRRELSWDIYNGLLIKTRASNLLLMTSSSTRIQCCLLSKQTIWQL